MFIDTLTHQRNYADIVGSRLDLFKIQTYSPYKANFRCPICGDSGKNRFKRRGYFLEKDANIYFYCHNGCGGYQFDYFLKLYHPDLLSLYKYDILQEMKNGNKSQYFCEEELEEVSIEEEKEEPTYEWPFLPLTKGNPLYGYLEKRMIDFDDVYYSDDFYRDVDTLIPGKVDPNGKKHTRIIFPLRKPDGDIFGFTARAIDSSDSPKYLTIKMDEDYPKIFGLNRLDKSEHAYVLEGPIDSLFVDNACALVGTDGNPLSIFHSPDDFTMVLDNQPRSEQVIGKYKKYIQQGLNIVIWNTPVPGKDINELILNGWSRDDVAKYLKKHTYKGLKATIMLRNWAKV